MTPGWLDTLRAGRCPVEWRDTDQRGLVLRVEVSGRRTWIVRYSSGGRERRFVVGTYPELQLGAARKAARRALAGASLGADPQVARERQRVGDTVAETIAAWLADEKQGPASRWKGGVEGGTARAVLPHIRRLKREFGRLKLAALTERDVERFAARGEAAATRNRALQAVRLLFAWAVRKGLLEADPSEALERERETERTRTLSDRELAALIRGFDATRYGRALRLLALTGLRRDEVLGARWRWLDAEAGILTIPPEAEKTGRSRGEPRRVALGRQALALLSEQRARLFREGIRSEYIFATSTGERPHRDALKPILYVLKGRRANGRPPSQDKRAKIRKRVIPADITVHDVRRTVGDALLRRLDVAPWIVDHVVLGHSRPKLIRTYMPTLPLDEARSALERWGDLLTEIVDTADAITSDVDEALPP